ncbi:DUF1217 domain-containing protein [Falsiroseomonas selenitidurans]|uniref:DUF1217 domain-containing protein n=1 Tax=Falsiroseomonas selenitidurans TaxID=2716335 RepID=A0ABX1EAJ1_9PROT|nr:DUF1217 domain-containing protein [Falsiroseomonas selenitidurans]NKC34201.1 DUF1217 domain-containing protein [Falsiroseomonas selenitidurans]
MLPGLGALTALAVAQREGASLQARFTARSDNKAAMERFRAAATQHADVESLMQDRRTLQVVLEAFQLEGEIDKRGILRKILTEDPGAEASLANRLTDRRWRELARAFAQREASDLTAAQVAALSTTDVQALSLAKIGGLTTEQAKALGTAQMRALGTQQLRALDATGIAALDVVDIAALDAAQVAALRPGQLAALGTAQIAAIDTADLAGLGSTQLRALSNAQVRALTTDQLAALGTEQAASLSRLQASGLTEAQRAALGSVQRAVIGTAPERSAAEEAAVAALDSRSPFAATGLLDRVVADAMTNRYEKAMGEDNAGLREALYFIRNASRMTSLTELMTDKALTAVVRGSLSLPETFGALEFEQQKTILTQRLKFEDLQDPKAVARMAQRYLALAAPSQTASNPLLALFDGSGASLGSLLGGGISLQA